MHKKVRFQTVETRFWKSYKRNNDLKHGLNDVTVALDKIYFRVDRKRHATRTER